MPTMAEASEDPPKRPRRQHDWDAYGVVIASMVGLLAILVSGYTAYLQRKQVQAQVWPRVELARNGLKGSIMASSNGIGPARVRAVRITVDGKAVRHWTEFAQRISYEGGMAQSQISGRVMPPGTEIDIVVGDGGAQNQLVRDIADFMWDDKPKHRVGILVCYCSVLDQCWLAGTGQLGGLQIDEDEEIDDCPIKDEEKFRQ
jgi:hypothetical protein